MVVGWLITNKYSFAKLLGVPNVASARERANILASVVRILLSLVHRELTTEAFALTEE